MRIKWLLILIGLTLVFTLNQVWADEKPIGKVIYVQGTGQATIVGKDSQKRKLERGASVYLNDHIITGGSTEAEIRLVDDSRLVVQPGSEFYVSEFSFDKKLPHSNKYVGNIVKGALLNISGQGETKNYRIDSPLTTIAFRGTGVSTELVYKGNIPHHQKIYVFKGKVMIKNKCELVIDRKCKVMSYFIGEGYPYNSVTVDQYGTFDGYMTNETPGGLNKEVQKSSNGGTIITCRAH